MRAKNFLVSGSLICLAMFFSTVTIYADYADWASSYKTVQINDTSRDGAGWNFATLFNKNFGTKFASGNDVWAAHGVIPGNSQWHIGENAMAYAGFKSASLAQDLKFTLSGNDVASWSHTYPGGNMDSINWGSGKAVEPAGWYNMSVQVGDEVYSLDPSANPDGKVHLLIFDISSYFADDANVDWAYLVAGEDLHADNDYTDWDFQDFSVVITGAKPADSVPEPATALIFGLGLGAVPFIRRWKKNAGKK